MYINDTTPQRHVFVFILQVNMTKTFVQVATQLVRNVQKDCQVVLDCLMETTQYPTTNGQADILLVIKIGPSFQFTNVLHQ